MIEIIPTSFLSISIFIFFVWILGLTVFLVRSIRHYNNLTKGITKKELKDVLNEVLKNISANSSEIEELKKLTDDIVKDNLYNVQKVGLTRYNPFAGTGGDQSFCLSLLDGNDNGIVISSLHSRDVTRIYAKPVKALKGAGYELSDEEKQAIKVAKKIKFKNAKK